MTWIEPLELETWFVQVFSGSIDIFTALAILMIAGMAGYFRMPLMIMFLMIGIFFLMFASFISSPMLLLIALFGGLAIGYTISKIFAN